MCCVLSFLFKSLKTIYILCLLWLHLHLIYARLGKEASVNISKTLLSLISMKCFMSHLQWDPIQQLKAAHWEMRLAGWILTKKASNIRGIQMCLGSETVPTCPHPEQPLLSVSDYCVNGRFLFLFFFFFFSVGCVSVFSYISGCSVFFVNQFTPQPQRWWEGNDYCWIIVTCSTDVHVPTT